jgi:MFS family permease
VIWRRIGGVVVGIIVWIVIVQVGEFVVRGLYSPPPGYNQRDMEQAKRYVATLPATAMVIVLVGQVVGTLAGAFAAAKIGRSRVPAYVIGALLLVAGVVSTFVIPQPLWFVVLELAGYIGATIAGAMLGSPHRVQTQSS